MENIVLSPTIKAKNQTLMQTTRYLAVELTIFPLNKVLFTYLTHILSKLYLVYAHTLVLHCHIRLHCP